MTKQDDQNQGKGISRREFAAGGVNLAMFVALGGLAGCKIRGSQSGGSEGEVSAAATPSTSPSIKRVR